MGENMGDVVFYISCIPTHYHNVFDPLGFKAKYSLTRNKHLKQIGFYDKQVFYNMLAMSRQKKP